MTPRLATAVLLALLGASSAFAAPPQTLNYQGRVKLLGGGPVANSATNTVQVRLCEDAGCAVVAWSDTFTNVASVDGLFNLVLGSGAPLNIPFDKPYWIGINFNGDGEMTPRSPLTSAPYAFRAAKLQTPAQLSDTLAQPVLSAENTGTGEAILGISNTYGTPAVRAQNFLNGLAFRAQGASLFDGALTVTGSDPGINMGLLRVFNTAGSSAAISAHSGNGWGMIADGAKFGVSATARNTDGVAYYGAVESTAPAAEFINNNPAGTPLKINNLRFPSGTGSSGQILATDGTSQLDWVTLPGVGAPLSLTSPTSASTISAYNPNGGYAIYASSAASTAIFGISSLTNAIQGQILAVTGGTSGIVGTVSGGSAQGYGVKGEVFAGNTSTNSASIMGIFKGATTPTLQAGAGVVGVNDQPNGIGVFGRAQGGVSVGGAFRGVAYGVSATTSSAGGSAIYAKANSTAMAADVFNDGSGPGLQAGSSSGVGVIGTSVGATGVRGTTSGGAGAAGVQGWTSNSTGLGVLAEHAGAGAGVALSATASGSSASAIVAQANSSAPATFLANNGAGPALRLGGNARVDSASNTITMASFVSFTAGTNLGMSVPNPLNLVGNQPYSGAIITASNTGSGHGIAGVATQPGITTGPVFDFSDTLTAGVFGSTSVSMSAGVLGWAQVANPESAGVLGMAQSGSGVYGVGVGTGSTGGSFDASGGIGVQGRGLTGVAAKGEASGGAAIVANAFSPSDRALHVQSGTSRLDGRTEVYASPVANVFALSVGVTGGSQGGAVYGNTGASITAAVRGESTDTTSPGPGVLPGRGLEGSGPIGVYATTTLPNGVGIISSVNTASTPSIMGFNFGNGVAVQGESTGGVALRGVGGFRGAEVLATQPSAVGMYVNQSVGARAIESYGSAVFENGIAPSSVTFNTHVHFSGAVSGLSMGVSAPLSLTLNSAIASPLSVSNSSGSAGSFYGLSGIAITANQAGLDIASKNGGAFTGAKIRGGTPFASSDQIGVDVLMEGDQRLQGIRSVVNDGGGGDVSVAVFASITNTATSPPDHAAVYATGGDKGYAIQAQNQSPGYPVIRAENGHFGGNGIVGIGGGGGGTVGVWGVTAAGVPGIGNLNAGVAGYNGNSIGMGVFGWNSNGGMAGPGVGGLGDAVGVSGTAANVTFGTGGFFQGRTGTTIIGERVGVLAAATGITGLAGHFRGVTALAALGTAMGVSATSQNGAAIYAGGPLGLDMHGPAQFRGQAAPAVAGASQGRIYFDSGANRFRVSENGGGYSDLVVSSGTYVDTAGDTMTGNLYLPTGGLTVGTNQFRVNSAGQVGIGTSGPGFAMDLVFNTATVDGLRLRGTNASSTPALMFQDSASVNRGLLYYSNSSAYMALQAEGVPLTFRVSAMERARINTSGYLGLGVTNPNTILDISGAFSLRGVTAVASAPGNEGRIYFDTGLSRFRVSENGGAFVDLLTPLGTYVAKTGDSMTGPLDIDGGSRALSATASSGTAGQFYSPAASGVGIKVDAPGSGATGLDVRAEGSGGWGAIISGNGLGLSVTASGGRAVYAASNTSTYGIESANYGSGPAVAGFNASTGGTGVYGQLSTTANNGVGVYGANIGTNNTGKGVYGVNNQANGVGVQALNTAGKAMVADGGTIGLSVTASGASGIAVWAANNNGNPTARFRNDNATGVAVEGSSAGDGKGIVGNSGGFGSGVYGFNNAGGYAVQGYNPSTGYAFYGQADSGTGVYGRGALSGVQGETAYDTGYGVRATNSGANGVAIRSDALAAGGKALEATGALIGIEGRVSGAATPTLPSGGVGVIGVNATNFGYGGFFKASGSSPKGLVVESTAIGISATSSATSAQPAIYANLSSTSNAIHAINDGSGIGVLGQGTGAGTGVRGSLISPNGGTAVHGLANSSNSFGVSAANTGATVAGGGAALRVDGIIRVVQTSVSVGPVAATTANVNGSNVRVSFNAGGAFQTLTVNNNVVTANSAVMLAFNTANQPGAYVVRVAAGVITINLAASLTVSATEGVNIVVINN